MSLQLAAKHLAAHGRGPDNTLVHMTPKEVESLQTLAMRHGGSLTINPQTGLPEAGFLSSILPLVAGAGLTAMGMPASMAALTVGGGTAMATGSLGKGLAAGLGAYGGSNLTASLIGAGAGAAPAAAAANAVPVETAASIAPAPPVPVAQPIEVVDPYKGMLKLTDTELSDAAEFNQEVAERQTRLENQFKFAEANQIDDVPKAFDSSRPNEVFPKMAKGITVEGEFPIPREVFERQQAALAATPDASTYKSIYTEPKVAASQSSIPPEVVAGNGTMSSQGTDARYLEAAPPAMYTKGAYLPSPKEMTAGERWDALKAGATKENLWKYAKENPFETAGMLAGPLMGAYEDYKDANKAPETKGDSDRGAMANAGYQFDPGWANPTPRADPYGREQTYNRPRYYIPKKAADGGAVQHFDEGGMVARASQSPMLQQFIEDQAARAAQPAPAQIDVKQQFADYLKAQAAPTTGVVPDTPAPTTQTAALGTAGISALTPETLGGESRGLSMEQRDEMNDPNSWANQSPEAHAQYYAANPTMGVLAQGAQNLFGYTPIGQAQQKYMGDFWQKQMQEKQGISPSSGLSYVTPAPSTTASGAPFTPSSPAVQYNVNQPGMFDGMDSGGARASNISGDGGDGGDGGSSFGGVGAHAYAHGGGISGGYNLGSYSDGGRLLRGPGDGVSDSIPAVIGRKQPARLADGEFVVPARIVSEIGNGSTEAGARKLYAMMDRVQKSRGKTIGKGKVAKNTRADKYLPA